MHYLFISTAFPIKFSWSHRKVVPKHIYIYLIDQPGLLVEAMSQDYSASDERLNPILGQSVLAENDCWQCSPCSRRQLSRIHPVLLV